MRLCVEARLLGTSLTMSSPVAGGAAGIDETGTNKGTHQMRVLSMGTLIDVPAVFTFFTRISQEPQHYLFNMSLTRRRAKPRTLYGFQIWYMDFFFQVLVVFVILEKREVGAPAPPTPVGLIGPSLCLTSFSEPTKKNLQGPGLPWTSAATLNL